MNTESKIKEFVKELSMYEFDEGVENPYHKKECIYNLEHYLKHILYRGSHIMLIGEAPGYKGCQLTGIPFTDEIQLKNAENYYALGDWLCLAENGNQREKTATIIWEVIRLRKSESFVPLMWNAFPFHPYNQTPNSNRKPSENEITLGLTIVNQLKEIFEITNDNIYAIGRVAQHQLGLPLEKYIRHPSYGGKADFVDGIVNITI